MHPRTDVCEIAYTLPRSETFISVSFWSSSSIIGIRPSRKLSRDELSRSIEQVDVYPVGGRLIAGGDALRRTKQYFDLSSSYSVS